MKLIPFVLLMMLPFTIKAQWIKADIGPGSFAPVNIYHMNAHNGKLFFITYDTSFISRSQAVYFSDDGGYHFDYLCRLSLNWGSLFYAGNPDSDTLLLVSTGGIMKKGFDSVSQPAYIVRFPALGHLYKPFTFFWGDSGIVIAGYTYKTYDKGKTWTWDSTRSNPPRLLTADYIEGTTRIIANDSKTLYASNDLGTTWDTLKDWSANGLFEIGSLTMTNSAVGYFYGRGSLYKTINGGADWNISGSSPTILSLKFITENYGFRLVHGQKQVAVTTDGKTWKTEQLLASTSRHSDRLYYFNDSSFFLTNNGNIYKRSPLALNTPKTVYAPVNFVVYPNPSAGLITIDLKQGITGFYYEIHDLLGRWLFSGLAESNQAIVSLTNLQTGTYVLTVVANEYAARVKIQKQ